ncbi:hypothetical protein AB0L25_17775, partial [Spirillospora sp. NPDC052242]
FTLTDELDDTTYTWTKANYVHLDPHTRPAHVLTVRRDGDGGGVRSDGSMLGADGTAVRSSRPVFGAGTARAGGS